ncbi:MAG: tetratricopeptide repeat protein [Spirochaetaceae bacterium]
MRTLIPRFILERTEEAETHGTIEGSALFLDLSGFTELTSALMEHGDEGAEVLSRIINTLFDPLIKEIDAAGGFVATFAGDAVTAVFPDRGVAEATRAAQRMLEAINANHLQYTPAGEFPVEAKIGLGYGAIDWGIINGRERSTYYFRGGAVEEAAAAEHRAERGSVVLGRSAVESAGEDVRLIRGDEGFAVAADAGAAEAPAGDSVTHLAPEKDEESGSSPTERERKQEPYLPPAGTPAGEGEFRYVASVFISFQAPSRHHATAELVRPVLDLANEYGGYFNLLDFADKGGVMLVLFGAPTTQGDDLERATDFALAANAVMNKRGRQGIAAGTVFAGYVGNRDRSTYTALGAIVNLSARLAMDADWATVVTAGEAAERLEARHTLEEIGKHRFKGFQKQMPVYVVSGATGATQAETPFVGRESLLSHLQAAVDEMLDSPVCTHYLLGEAGVGKSRLARRVAGSQQEDIVTVVLEVDTILRKSMNALPRLVRGAFEIARIDLGGVDGSTAMERLTSWFRDRDINEETVAELHRSGSGLSALLGHVGSDSLYAQLDPQARFELTATGVRALVEALSSVYPLLIIVDNAHALDADTRSIFSRLASASAGEHFGTMFVGRGTASTSPFAIEENVDADRITVLPGLNAQEVRRVIGNVIQGPVEESLVDFAIHRVGTNPLYVTELARYLVHHRLLTRGESGYRVSTEDVSLPTEINALLVARVDSLPPGLKAAAQAAAILGAEFDPVVLGRLVNAGPEFQETLNEGEKAGLWARSDEGRYRFQQDLIRQAIEDMQLSATLQHLHTRAATLLRQLHPDDPTRYADLAYHFIRAGLREEARQSLRKAADYALANFKNEKALEFLETYQDYAATVDERIAAYRDMASIYELTGRWRDAIDTLTYAVGLTVISNNLGARARLLAALGEVYRKQSENTTAISILEQSRQLAKREKDFSTYAEALIYLGRSHWARGDYGNALAHLDQALKTSTDHDDLRLEGLALYYQGVVYRDQNRYDEADGNFHRSYDIFRQISDDRLSTYPLYDLGVVRLYQGKIDEAKEYFQRALDVYQRIGYESGASAATLNLGVLRDRRGDFTSAIRFYQEARAIAERINEHLAIGYTLFSIGATYYKMGDNRKSLAYLRDAFRIVKRLGAKGYYGYVLSYLASLFARTGNAERAIHTAHQHTQVVAHVGSDPENGRAVMSLAQVLEHKPSLSAEAQQQLRRIARHYNLTDISPARLYEKAIEISDPPKYVDTLIPSHFHYAEYLKRQGDDEGFRAHLRSAFELAADAHWDRFVRRTREHYGTLLAEMGVNTEVETEDFDLGDGAGQAAG